MCVCVCAQGEGCWVYIFVHVQTRLAGHRGPSAVSSLCSLQCSSSQSSAVLLLYGHDGWHWCSSTALPQLLLPTHRRSMHFYDHWQGLSLSPFFIFFVSFVPMPCPSNLLLCLLSRWMQRERNWKISLPHSLPLSLSHSLSTPPYPVSSS